MTETAALNAYKNSLNRSIRAGKPVPPRVPRGIATSCRGFVLRAMQTETAAFQRFAQALGRLCNSRATPTTMEVLE